MLKNVIKLKMCTFVIKRDNRSEYIPHVFIYYI
jgi:hypothetical protein